MRPFIDTPLNRWLVDTAHGVRNRLALFTRIEVKMGVRLGVFEKPPRGWRRCWAGVCIGGSSRRPVVLLSATLLGLDLDKPPQDEGTIRRVRNVLLHELLHAVRGMGPEPRAHGREFTARCRLAAPVFRLMPPGPHSPATIWPSIRPVPTKRRKKRRHAAHS